MGQRGPAARYRPDSGLPAALPCRGLPHALPGGRVPLPLRVLGCRTHRPTGSRAGAGRAAVAGRVARPAVEHGDDPCGRRRSGGGQRARGRRTRGGDPRKSRSRRANRAGPAGRPGAGLRSQRLPAVPWRQPSLGRPGPGLPGNVPEASRLLLETIHGVLAGPVPEPERRAAASRVRTALLLQVDQPFGTVDELRRTACGEATLVETAAAVELRADDGILPVRRDERPATAIVGAAPSGSGGLVESTEP